MQRWIRGTRSVLRLGGRFGLKLGEIGVGDFIQFGTDDVGGEAGGEEAAVKRGELAPVKRRAEVGEAAPEASANERSFVGFGENGCERGVNVLGGNAASAEFAGDAEASVVRVDAALRVIEGVASVVEVTEFAEAGDDARDQRFIFGAAGEVRAHFVDGVSAAHQGALGGEIELLLGRELPLGSWAVAHRERFNHR